MASNILVLIGLSVFFAVIIWSFWYEFSANRALPKAGEMVKTTYGHIHLISRGQHREKGRQPLVLIHGSTTNALDMDLEIAGRLEKDRLVLMPDRPGHGFSHRAEDGFRLDVQAAAIREAVKIKTKEKPVIMGQSYGAAVALRYALDYPDEVAGIVLIAPVSHRWPGGVAWYNRVALNPIYGWIFRRTFIALYGRFGSPKGVAKALRGSQFSQSYHARTRVPLTFRPSRFYNNAEDIVRLYEQLAAMEHRYGTIRVPVEIVAGTHDMTVVISIHARRLEDQIEQAQLRVVDAGGHALHHTHPEETVAAIARVDTRLANNERSPLQGALRRLTSVFPRSA
ncbi:alpha/beta hydrolase [Parvularcula sp. LCG005]|uniref:alpha/beta fold hydrolase n=1 Tax=Parvularcula sp. LCG005 TaxID=3078805 RepID=UPI002942D9E1|nr:alpha/beta hydrolase [Parvularcula sp. LCG005]WOI52076.1 alpha/beta hydrolase [Parvularcula sp. LCG005]